VLDPGSPTPAPGQPAPGKLDKRNQSGDPRVDAACALLDLVNATTGQAFEFHYDAGLRAWASKLAQAKEGVDAMIDGLSRRVRKKLAGKTSAEAKLPLVADGSTGSRTMRVGVTEHGRVLNLTSSNSGTKFLEKRGKGDKVQGARNVAANVLNTKLPNIDSA
jgi:hypothetical protein